MSTTSEIDPNATVLTHPAFDREPVINARHRGRRSGVVSLNVAKRTRHSKEDAHRALVKDAARRAEDAAYAAGLASWNNSSSPQGGANDCPALPPSRPAASVSRAPGMADHERAVIGAALAILSTHLREPGAVVDAPTRVRQFLTLHLAGLRREAFGVLFVDATYRVIAFEVLFEGTLTQTSVYPRDVARRAFELDAAAVILAHNHPSGVAAPSRADEYVTQTLKSALSLIDVRTLDHVIVAGLDTFSFAERGLM